VFDINLPVFIIVCSTTGMTHLKVSNLYCTVLNFTHFTKTYTSLHLTTLIYTSRPTPPIPFPSPQLTDLHLTSIPFTSLPLSLSIPSSRKYLISSVLQNPFTSLSTFLTFYLYILDFTALQNPFMSLHSSHFSPFSWKYSISFSL